MARKYKKRGQSRNAAHDLVARPKAYKPKTHHAKPFRFRHIGLLIVALVLLLAIVFQTGVFVGSSRLSIVAPEPAAPDTSPQLRTLKSGYGFSFSFNDSVFKPTATAIDDKGVGQTVADSDLAAGKQINMATIRPKAGTVPSTSVATQFSVQVLPGTAEFDALKANPASAGKTDAELAAQLMPITSSNDFDVTKVSSANDTIGDGTPALKTTYQFTPKFTGGTSYAVVWNGVVNGRPFAVKLAGLLGASTTPTEYQDVFTSLSFDGTPKVQGVSFSLSGTAYAATQKLDSKYLSDSVSPAVVKIYHVVCGTLIVGTQKSDYFCDGMTGSGFLVSNDGYIATNGHVAVLTAKDIFVGAIISSPDAIIGYLKAIGLTDAQIDQLATDPQKLASLIAKIYDISDDQILIDGKKEVTLVATGKTPLMLTEQDSVEKLFEIEDSDAMKNAEVVGYDYSGKDLLVAQSGDPQGFSSSDVALLKIKTSNAPTIPLIAGQMTQNEKITVLGFPGDAENSLVDNSTLDVSVTNGSISAIKDAAGGKAKLYQSDADASHGNSGGPAINEAGEVFGLLTYRIAGDNQGNAAKSYMRDIADFSKLAKDKNVTFNAKSTTQETWQKGLKLFSQNHFSAAKDQFLKVKKDYPAHRLVGSYIENADKQIAAGNDVRLISPVMIAAGVAVALALLGTAIVLIVRHRSRHQTYISQQPPTSPAGGTPPPQAPAGGSPLPPPPASSGMPTPMSPAAQPMSPAPAPLPASSQPMSPPAAQPWQQPARPQPVVDGFSAAPAPTVTPAPVASQPPQASTVVMPTVINPTQQQ